MNFTDILSSLGVLFDSLPQGLLALFYGFQAVPTAIGFALAAVGAAIWHLPTPVSFQAETTILAGGLGKNVRERVSMIVFAGITMMILGATGTLGTIVNFIGPDVLYGMLAGVGIILVKSALDLFKKEIYSGVTSIVVALIVWLTTSDLIYTCVISVIVASIAYKVAGKFIIKDKEEEPEQEYKGFKALKLMKPVFNKNVLRGTLAVVMLQIAGNISYGTITSGMANMPGDVDKLSILGGAATTVSGMFGGAPLSAIISATATADHAVTAGVLLMALAAVVIASKLFLTIGKLVPISAVAGFLFVLGTFVVFPGNAATALSGNTVIGGVTAVITATVDPFVGMLAGTVLKIIGI